MNFVPNFLKPHQVNISESSTDESSSDYEVDDKDIVAKIENTLQFSQLSNDSISDREADELEVMMRQVVQIDNKHPIILLPGLCGSKLITTNRKTKEQIVSWIPPNLDFKKNSDIIMNTLWGRMDEDGWYRSFGDEFAEVSTIEGISGTYKIFDNPITDSSFLKKRRVGTYYDVLFDFLVSSGYTPGRNLFAYTYDWRQNPAHWRILKGFGEIIKIAQLKNPRMKLNIIAHSMGGHIVMEYMKLHSDWPQIFRRFIALTVPFDGSSAHLYSGLLRGYNLQTPLNTFLGRALGSSIGSTSSLLPNPQKIGGQTTQVFVQKYQKIDSFTEKSFKQLNTSAKDFICKGETIQQTQAIEQSDIKDKQYSHNQLSVVNPSMNKEAKLSATYIEGVTQLKQSRKIQYPLPDIHGEVVEVIMDKTIYGDRIPDVSFLILQTILKDPMKLSFDRSNVIMRLRNGCQKGSVMVIKKTNKRLKIMKQHKWHLDKIYERKSINLKNRNLPMEWVQFNLWQPYKNDYLEVSVTRPFINTNPYVKFLKGLPILKNSSIQQQIESGLFENDIIITEKINILDLAIQYQFLLEQREFARINTIFDNQIAHDLDSSKSLFQLIDQMNPIGTFEHLCFYPDMKVFKNMLQISNSKINFTQLISDNVNIEISQQTIQHESIDQVQQSIQQVKENESISLNCDSKETFRFYSYVCCGIPTPLHLIFTQPVYDIYDLNFQHQEYLFADGDGTVLLPNALNDGFPPEVVAERIVFHGVRHANVMKSPRIIERIMNAIQ